MLTVAYIGFGNSVCRYHLPYLEKRKKKVKVKYVYRRMEDRINDEERETWYPDILFTSDLQEVMEDQDVNLIVVNTPNKFHVNYTMMALDHGKHVLCEKPFALTAKEAEEVYAHAKEKGLVVMANQNRRFDGDMLTLKKVLAMNVLGDLIDVESHYDYYRPNVKNRTGFVYLLGLAVHTLDQVIGEFGIPQKVIYDCRSVESIGESDEYFDFDLCYPKGLKVKVKTNYYVKLAYPRFIVHGTKGSFLLTAMGHQSSIVEKPGPINISFDPISEDYDGVLSYIDEEGNDITKKISYEVGDYGMIYDNLYEVICHGKEKVIKDEEVIEVLKIIEQGIAIAKEAGK